MTAASRVLTSLALIPMLVQGQGLSDCPRDQPVAKWSGCYGEVGWDVALYIGDFRDGRAHGLGVYIWPGGEQYVGEFVRGLPEGRGVEYSRSGEMKNAGLWRDGRLIASIALDLSLFRFRSTLDHRKTRAARLTFDRQFEALLKSTSGLSWRERLDRAVASSLRQWLLPDPQDLADVQTPAYPAALSLKQDAWETNIEFEDRVEKARTERRQTIDRLQTEYRAKVEERNRRAAEYNKTRQEREAGLPQRRRELILIGLGALAPTVALSEPALDQQTGALTVAAQVEGLGKQSFAFIGTPLAFRRAALTEPQNLRAKPEFEVSDNGEITLSAVSLESDGATARGLPAAGAAQQLQLATVTLPQFQSAPVAQQSAFTVDRNQVEQILYREENESLRRRLEEQRRQQEQAVANAESRAAAEISRLKAEADVLRNQPSQSRLSPALAAVREAHALVIGNSAYPGSSRLANPVNDARAMAAKLRSLGFRVTEVPNATREQLVRGLSDFTRTAAQADLTLLFYAGHGVQIGGVNYMIPVDMSLTDPAQAPLQGVSLNSVVEQYMPGKAKLVFLDACRDNPLMASAGRGITKGLAPINVSEGTLIAYATKDGQVAEDGVGQSNSPFTSALLEHLADPDDIAVVLRTVRAKVMQRTNSRQQPWEYGSLTGGALVLSAIGPRR
jgi:hypothetical protein